MANRYLDWYRQAEADLNHARHALKDGDYDWSCFAAQQAAEKAIKAVFQKRSMEAWGHTLTVLVGNLQSVTEVPDSIIRGARILDKHYIPSRYPNGFDSGAPTDFYTREESQNAIRIAEDILEFCHHQID
ncbi:HEPN domain-containing protein [bacterium]|nr:HEPN domain-containing protein [bacterium]RQV99125.1 MAG: HEPN domain-containing protein [bacterium]